MSMTKIAGSGSESGSICQRHGSANPDLYQNVMDPQHCCREIKFQEVNGKRFIANYSWSAGKEATFRNADESIDQSQETGSSLFCRHGKCHFGHNGQAQK